MTEDKLNQLFDSARNVRVETSQEEVTRWLATAAVAAVGAGAAASGFKLLLTKNMIAMIAGTLSVAGIAVVSTSVFSGSSNEPASQNQHVVTYIDSNKNKMDSETTFYARTVLLDPPAEDEANESTELADMTSELNPTVPLSPLFNWDAVSMAPTINRACQPIEVQQPWVTAGRKDTAKAGITTHELAVKPFNKLHIDGIFDVIIRQGADERVVVESESDGSDLVSTEQVGDMLILTSNHVPNEKERDKGCMEVNHLVVYVTVKDLSYLLVSGIGTVTTELLNAPQMTVEFDGVGDLHLHLNSKKFDLISSGVGNVFIEGEADRATYEYSGVGDINASDFKTQHAVINSTAIGNLIVFVDQSISIEANGIGDIIYMGNASTEHINTSGMSRVRSDKGSKK